MKVHDKRQINTSGRYGKPKPLPKVYDKTTLRIAEARASICQDCEHAEKVTPPKKVGKFTIASVKCSQCGCASLNLLRKKCPIGRHPE